MSDKLYSSNLVKTNQLEDEKTINFITTIPSLWTVILPKFH